MKNLLVLMVFVTCVLVKSVFAWDIAQITNNDYYDGYPQANSKGQLVWGSENGLHFYDGFSTNKISNSGEFTLLGSNNNINDNGNVVFKSYYNGNDEIFLYNGATTLQLTNNSYDDSEPSININGYVTWRGRYNTQNYDFEAFLYNGSTITQLTNNSYDDQKQQINIRNHMVWNGNVNGYNNIFFYDGATTQQLTNNSYNQNFPKINVNDQIVWEGSTQPIGPHIGSDIFFYDGSNIARITNNTYDDAHVQISDNGKLVWVGDMTGSASGDEIFYYDGVNTIRLTNNSFYDRAPHIFGDNIVWNSYDGHDWEILLYDGLITTQLTNNEYDDIIPQISGNYVAWSGYDGHDYEIFRATSDVVPEPAAMFLFGLGGFAMAALKSKKGRHKR